MRGTTPYLLIRTKLRDLTGAQVIILTIQQNGRVHNYQGDRVHIISVDEDGTLLCVHLTQEETLALCPGVYEIQISWIDASGESSSGPCTGMSSRCRTAHRSSRGPRRARTSTPGTRKPSDPCRIRSTS